MTIQSDKGLEDLMLTMADGQVMTEEHAGGGAIIALSDSGKLNAIQPEVDADEVAKFEELALEIEHNDEELRAFTKPVRFIDKLALLVR